MEQRRISGNVVIGGEAMGQQLNEKVESILVDIRPSLGGGGVRLVNIGEGIVTLEYQRVLSNSSCHMEKTKATKELVNEILEDKLKSVVPGFKKIILLGED